MFSLELIRKEVKENDILLFMKGTPASPSCGFSAQVVQILDRLRVHYKSYNVYESEDLRQGIKIYSEWPTVPQLYVHGEFIGGCDIVTEMFHSGELEQLLSRPEPAVTD